MSPSTTCVLLLYRPYSLCLSEVTLEVCFWLDSPTVSTPSKSCSSNLFCMHQWLICGIQICMTGGRNHAYRNVSVGMNVSSHLPILISTLLWLCLFCIASHSFNTLTIWHFLPQFQLCTGLTPLTIPFSTSCLLTSALTLTPLPLPPLLRCSCCGSRGSETLSGIHGWWVGSENFRLASPERGVACVTARGNVLCMMSLPLSCRLLTVLSSPCSRKYSGKK